MNNFVKHLLLNIALINLLSNSSWSQVYQGWIERYSETENSIEGAIDIATDNLGNAYITGQFTRTPGSSNANFLTIKYNCSGIEQWIAEYNGPGDDQDFVKAITIDNSGNIFVTGCSKGISSEFDYVTIKYNSSGIQQWSARFNGSRNSGDQAHSIAVDASGNVYVTGGSINDVNNQEDIITIKYNSSGTAQWIRTYNSQNGEDIGFAVKLDKNNNVYVTGSSNGDFITLKYDSQGIQQWASTYDGIAHWTDESKYLVLDDSRNVYVAGLSLGTGNYEDYVVVKYNSSGIEQWSRRYDGSASYFDKPCGIGLDKNDNVYVGGYSTESSTGYDFTVIKYNNGGQQLWISHYNNVLNDLARSMTMDSSGNVYITGNIYRSSTGSDYATVKFDSSGALCWSMIYTSEGDSLDIPYAVSVDNSGSVFVTGSSGTDYLTIKYSQLTGFSNASQEVPFDYNLGQNYPNPFNPKTIINYKLQIYSDVKLYVHGVSGNEIITLVNTKQNAGSHQVEFDGSKLSSGIYFYSLSVDGRNINTKKMILLK